VEGYEGRVISASRYPVETEYRHHCKRAVVQRSDGPRVARKLAAWTVVRIGAKDSHADLSSDGYTITVNQDDIQAASGGDALVVTYTAYARKASEPSQITTDTLSSLINDQKALESLALDYGAMRVSTGLNLPPNALSSAAGLLRLLATVLMRGEELLDAGWGAADQFLGVAQRGFQ